MAWIDDINSMADVNDVSTGNWNRYKIQQQLSRLPKQQKKKGFWQDQISTVGGIGGGIAGGAAGGALAGTAILPGVGTVAGGLIGALLGGAAGSAGGEAIENIQTGDNITKNLAKEAALGGIFSVGPIRALNVAGKAGMATAKGQGVNQAIETAATQKPIRNMLGKGFGAASDDMAIRGIKPSKSQLNRFKKNTGEDMASVLKRNNLVGREVDEVNTLIGGLDDKFGQIVAGTPDIPKANVMQAITQQVDLLKSAGPTDLAKAGDDLLAEAQEVLAKYGDTVPASAVQQLKRQYDSLVNFTNRQSNPARTSVNERVGNALRETLRTSADNAGLSDAGMSLKQIGQESSKLKAIRDLMEEQANLGRGTNPLGLGTLMAGTAGGVGGGVGGALGMAAASRAINSAPAMRLGAKAAGNAAERLSSPSRGNTVGGVIGRQAGQGAFFGGLNQATTPGPDPQVEAERSALEAALRGEAVELSGSELTGAMEQPQAPMNPFGVSQEEVAAQMVLALQAGDTKGFGNLKDIYEMIGEYNEASASAGTGSGKPETVEGQKAYNNAMAGMKAISDIEAILAEDSSMPWKAALPGGALTDSLLGASKYETALRSAMDSMARLRTGAAMTETEVKNFRAMLPKAGDSPDTVQYKLNNFREYFNEVLNQPAGGTAPSSLEEAMLTF